MINDMKDHGFKECVIASAGNAAISLSAMAACEGIKVNVFVSKDISPERLNLITLFEPKLHLVDGTYDDAMLESENYAKHNKLYSANPGHNKNKMLGDWNAGRRDCLPAKAELARFPNCTKQQWDTHIRRLDGSKDERCQPSHDRCCCREERSNGKHLGLP